MGEDNQIYSNDNATQRVPEHERKSTFDVAMVSAGFCICMSGLFTGAAMAVGLSFKQAIIAGIVGNLILAVYGGALGVAGTKAGVSTSMLARKAFGREGSKIVSLVLALTMLGWYSVQVGFFGDTIHAMFPDAGFITDKPVAAFWGGIVMLLTAYFGFKGLSFLSKIAVPLIILTSIIGIIAAVNHAGSWNSIFAIQPSQSITLGAAIVMVVGSFAAGASAQADITRYAKSAKASIIATIIGYMVANLFIIIAGFITNIVTGVGDLPAAMLQLGLGIPALIVLIFAQWTTNDNNLYTSSLGLANILQVKKSKIVLVSGIIATIIGAAGLSNYFINWLIILGIGVPPMAGVIVGDYYFISKQNYVYDKGTEFCVWNFNAIISWGIACFIGYFWKWGISSLNSLVAGLVIYIIIMKITETSKLGQVGKYLER